MSPRLSTARAPLATGCVHVYGTSDLGEKMRYISGTAFDLAPYLKDVTKGEADLTVALGSHTFIKGQGRDRRQAGGRRGVRRVNS